MSEGTRRPSVLILLVALCSVVVACPTACAQGSKGSEWPAYGNDPGGMRYSPLSHINRENVATLKVAWIFHTGDISDGRNGRKRSGFETTASGTAAIQVLGAISWVDFGACCF